MKYTVGIFLINQENKLLICHPTGAAGINWSVPKGMPDDDDETKKYTGIRELKEETNINYYDIETKIIRELKFNDIIYKTGKKTLVPFLIEFNGTYEIKNLKCNSIVETKEYLFPEVDEFKWVSLEEAKTLVHETQKQVIDQIIKLKNE